jgi:hypothetical protein
MLSSFLVLFALSTPVAPQETVQPFVQISAHDLKLAPVPTADVGVTLWVYGGDDGPELHNVQASWETIRLVSRPADAGDAVWVELLSARLEIIATYPTSLPEQGSVCALQLPAFREAWWVVLMQRKGDSTHVLATYQLGPRLNEIFRNRPLFLR